MTEHETLNLDEIEKPVYRIKIGGETYDFDPLLMAVELDRNRDNLESRDLGRFHDTVKLVLGAGALGEVPELTLAQAISVVGDYTTYFEGVQKKMLSSLGLPDSTDTKVDERWQEAQASATESTSLDSTSTSTSLVPGAATSITEPLMQQEIRE